MDTHQHAALGLTIGHRYSFVCRDALGRIKWTEEADNLVVTDGRNDILDKYYRGATYTAAHYVGLLNLTGVIAAADTMAAHAGWTEVTAYTEAARPTLTMGVPAAGSTDNTLSVEVYTANAASTVHGAFVTTVATKGDTTGILVGASSFATARSLISGDTLEVTVTASLTSS